MPTRPKMSHRGTAPQFQLQSLLNKSAPSSFHFCTCHVNTASTGQTQTVSKSRDVCLHFHPFQASHYLFQVDWRRKRKKEKRNPCSFGWRLFPISTGSRCSPRYQWAGSFVQIKGFPESSREPEGKDSQQMFSLSESRRYSAGNVVPWFDNSGNAAIRVDWMRVLVVWPKELFYIHLALAIFSPLNAVLSSHPSRWRACGGVNLASITCCLSECAPMLPADGLLKTFLKTK